MVKKLIIVGAGGFGREASLLIEEISAAEKAKQWKLLGFVDDDKNKWGTALRGYVVLGGTDYLRKANKILHVCIVIGDPVIKRKIVEEVRPFEVGFATIVHPDLKVEGEVKVGRGSLINKGCLLTINITIGEHVSINPGCCIGHDVEIGDYTTLMWRVNISGNVKIGKGCLLGTGATVLQGLKIGNGVTVGAGALVTKDLPDHCTAVGIPARVVKESPSPRPSLHGGEGD